MDKLYGMNENESTEGNRNKILMKLHNVVDYINTNRMHFSIKPRAL